MEPRVYCKDWGDKQAQPTMFHHGWPLTGDEWDGQMLFLLAEGYRVIVHDRHRHGRSSQTMAASRWTHTRPTLPSW